MKRSSLLPVGITILKTFSIYAGGKVTVRGLGVLKPEKQLDNLLEWFKLMQAGLTEKEELGLGAIA
jgi:transcription-repair coupling factor (superfamily II helicase)